MTTTAASRTPPTPIDERLDETFAALASTTRRAILGRLMGGAATVNELAAPFDMTLPAISKHIKVLERAGLITRGRNAQFRPCAIEAAPLLEVATWAEQYRPIWEGRFDRMAEYLDRVQDAAATPTPTQTPTPTSEPRSE